MAAIPIIIYDNGFISQNKGSLINPPVEIFARAQMSFYSLTKPGWCTCPLGYHVFTAYDDLGRKLVVPGIYPPGERAPKRKFGAGYPLKFSKSAIEEFAKAHLDVVEQVRQQRDDEFKNLTHDLRALGNEIYHGALAIRDYIQAGKKQLAEIKIDQIINSQQMLSLRLDIIDYEGGLSSERPKELIDPFPKIDKVLRSFKGLFQSKGIRFQVSGKCNNQIYGPPIFELVPFVIVENALKYAPTASEILIRYEEDIEKTVVRFESLGPRISAAEQESIFDKDFRGEAARDAGKTGSGIGLFAAKTIVENHFGGEIYANQLEQEAVQEGTAYYKTRFTLVLPSQDRQRHRR